MTTKVYILMRDDGNVCCGSDEIAAVYSTRAAAQTEATVQNSKPRSEYHRVVEWDVF